MVIKDRRFIVWDVDVRTVPLNAIFEWCFNQHRVDRVLFAVRPSSDGKKVDVHRDVQQETKRLLGQEMITSFTAKGWPGTELTEQKAVIFVACFTPSLAERIVERQPLAIHWRQKNKLPEDLCLFRDGDHHPVFVSVTHEEEAWLLTDRASTFTGASHSDHEVPRLLFHAGTHFCMP